MEKVLIALDYGLSAQKIAEKGYELAKKRHSNIIVMGSHSKNWLEKAVMGGVTESVLSKTKIPMYIIPIKEHN